MKIEEIIMILNDHLILLDNGKKPKNIEKLQVAGDKAIKALKKQIPKKPIIYNQLCRNRYGEQFLLDDYEANKCPICNNDIISGITYRAKYCSNCGQAIDWSGD